jgi:hypothetical protein
LDLELEPDFEVVDLEAVFLAAGLFAAAGALAAGLFTTAGALAAGLLAAAPALLTALAGVLGAAGTGAARTGTIARRARKVAENFILKLRLKTVVIGDW